MLEGDKLLAEIKRYSRGHAAQIGSLIDEKKASTAFRADLDTRRPVASLVGMVQYLAVAERVLFPSTKLTLNRTEREAMSWHTAELFLRAVAAKPESLAREGGTSRKKK